MMRVAIIGSGLAGSACAYVLKRYGAEPVIYEAGSELSGGASGNPIGLYNPRLSAERTAESDYFAAGFALAVRIFREFEDIDWSCCGSLHLITDGKRAKRFAKTAQNWGWDSDHMRLLSSEQASEAAGVDLQHEALFLPDAGYVSPQKLCAAYVRDVEIHLNQKIESAAEIEADAVILACGTGIKDFEETAELPVQTVRGQITQVRATDISTQLLCNLCYGGYFTPALNGVHTLGATFQRWLDHTEVLDDDDQDNLASLAVVAPNLAAELEVIDNRASLRVASKDYFPVVGHVPGHKNLYVSAAHGSHGIISTIVSAHLLADMILEAPISLSKQTIQALQPARFLV